jgi:hypothetical protein
MLLSSLDRQGVDLSFTTDPGTGSRTLLYMDFTNFRMGVNTASIVSSTVLTVEGNISVNSSIITSSTNRHMYLTPNGTGQVIISNASILTGNIEATTIGLVTPAYAKFTTANTTGKATLASAQVINLTPGRVVFSDGTGLTDNVGLQYFTSNSTLRATNLESAGSIGYSTVAITTGLFLNYASQNQVPYFAANSMFVTNNYLNFFQSNGVLRANSVQLNSQPGGQILYTNSSNAIVGSSYLTFNGQNLTATGITTLGGIQIQNQTISGVGTDQDILIAPQGAGTLNMQVNRITNLGTPTNSADAATKAYVDGLIALGSTTSIGTQDSKVAVYDTGAVANVSVIVNGSTVATFKDSGSSIGDFSFYNNFLSTLTGEMTFVPANNKKFVVTTTSALTLPVGLTTERSGLLAGTSAAIGDIRYNTELGTIEWYTGSRWTSGTGSNAINSQVLVTDGTSSIYTLAQSADSNSVLVSINGTTQQPGTSYSVVGNQITFTEIPLVSDVVEIRFLAAGVVYAANPIFINTNFANVSKSGTTMDSFNIVQYRSATYQYTVKNTLDPTNGLFQVGEIFLVQNNITANVVVQPRTTLGTPTTGLVNWSTAIDGQGILTLIATATGESVATTAGNVNLSFTSRGLGYSAGTVTATFSAPQVSGGKTAVAGTVYLFANGAINAVQVTNVGSGYTSAPSITFGGTNTGAASATVTGTVATTLAKISRLYFNDA